MLSGSTSINFFLGGGAKGCKRKTSGGKRVKSMQKFDIFAIFMLKL